MLGSTLVETTNTTTEDQTNERFQKVSSEITKKLMLKAEKFILKKQQPNGDWNPCNTNTTTTNVGDDDDTYNRFVTTRWAVFSLCKLRFRGWGPAPSNCDYSFHKWKEMEKYRYQYKNSKSSNTSTLNTSTLNASLTSSMEDQLRSNPFGIQLYPKEYYQHITLYYDYKKQQELLFKSLTLKRKLEMRMSALVE